MGVKILFILSYLDFMYFQQPLLLLVFPPIYTHLLHLLVHYLQTMDHGGVLVYKTKTPSHMKTFIFKWGKWLGKEVVIITQTYGVIIIKGICIKVGGA